jgi:hypothetical protein
VESAAKRNEYHWNLLEGGWGGIMVAGEEGSQTCHVDVCLLTIIIIIIIIIIVIIITAIELSLGGSSPYTSTDKTNRNKYT